MKKLSIRSILAMVGAVLALIAIFLPLGGGFQVVSGNSTVTCGTGYGWIFGGQDFDFLVTLTTEKIAVLTVGWVLLLIGLLLAIAVVVLSFLGKEIKLGSITLGQILVCAAALLLIVGGILLFCGKGAFADFMGFKASDCKNSAGLIFAGILSILSGVVVAVPLFLKK
jgi:hypothetical protein